MIELRALGTLELRNEDGTAVDAVLSQPKRAAILVYLAAASRGDYVRRDPLLALFWPEQNETKARGSLRQALYALKKDLGGDLLPTRGDDEVGLNADVLWCDVRAFDEALSAGELERAVELYRGPFLSGFFLKGSAEFDQWVEGERDRLVRECGRALETLAEHAVERDDVQQAVEWLRRLATHNPYSTRVALKYMEALAAAGDRAGALKYAERLSERVEEDLGAAPSPDVTSLAERLKREPVARHETRFIRVKDRTPAGGIEAVRAALSGDRYTVERELGSGGMATVYLAEDAKHHRNVAIKVLKPELATAIGPDRFLREIEIVAQLHHPHILPVHDSGEAGQFLYYVMPFVEGESVRDRLRRETQLPIDDAVAIASQVASALDYAHRKQIVHRDIKPENILLQDGQALVADFGIALAVQAVGDTRLTETGLSIGTPQYMSPEQAAGDRVLDGRSDVYSLGCVLYEMLAGEPPHTGPTTQAILAKIATDEPRDIAALRKTVPEQVQLAVHKALAKLPADRFGSGGAFSHALGTPSASRPSARWSRASLDGRWLVAAAAMTLLIVVFSYIAGMRSGRAAATPSRVARLALDIPTSDFDWSFDVSPDGSRVAFMGDGRQLFVRDVGSLAARTVEGASPGQRVFFSPDGAWLAFHRQARGATWWRIPVEGGTPTVIVGGLEPNSWFYGADWGSDGLVYFTDGQTSGLFRIPATGGEVEVVTTVDRDRGEHNHRYPHVLPGGRGIVFTSWWGDSALVMAHSFESGETVRVARGTTPRYLADGYLLFGAMDRSGTLHAVRFDANRLTASGSPVAVATIVAVDMYGRAVFDLTIDGSLVYQPMAPPQEEVIDLVDRQGRRTPFLTLTDAVLPPAAISPDGSRLAYTQFEPGAANMWVKDTDGVRRRITSRGGNWYPTWSPDGQHLVFMSDRRGGGFSLYKKRADGAGEAVLVLERAQDDGPADWSPDGRSIVFFDSKGTGIWTVSVDDSATVRPLMPECDPHCSYTQYSPDGRHVLILFGGDEWFVANVEDPFGTRQRVSLDARGIPWARWSPDGREVYYVNRQDQIVAAALTGDEQLRLVNRTPLFALDGRRFLDIHPDGRFVMGPPVDDMRPPMPVIVLNFVEELKAIVQQ